MWESTNVNITPKLEMHVSFVPDAKQAEEDAIHNERRAVSLILKLSRNEEAVKSAIHEVGGIRYPYFISVVSFFIADYGIFFAGLL